MGCPRLNRMKSHRGSGMVTMRNHPNFSHDAKLTIGGCRYADVILRVHAEAWQSNMKIANACAVGVCRTVMAMLSFHAEICGALI